MKKLVCLLMATLLLVALCCALTACGECKHGEYATEYEIVDPTCTTDGKYVYTCLKCNEKVEVAPTADDVVMLKTGHTADAGEVTTAPTCTATGEKTFKCKTCDAAMPEKTETVAALGHEVDEDEFASDGTNHWNTCSREGCGAKVNEEAHDMYFGQYSDEHCAEVCDICLYVDEDSKAEHAFDDGVETKAATCSKTGTMTYTCENCGFEKEEDIATTAHTYDETTYVSDATNHWHACTVCGAVKEGSVAACVYGTPVENPPVDGSCAPGTKVSTCTGCGGEKVETIPSTTAHKLTNATLVDDSVEYTCSSCSFVYTVKGVTGLTDFETSGSSAMNCSPASESAWKTEVVTEADGNKCVSSASNEIFENGVNGTAYRITGPYNPLNYDFFIMDMDVKANPEKGMSGTTNFAPKAEGDTWPGSILAIEKDGSITGGGAGAGALASAGTVNGDTWTHITILYNSQTGELAYYINGVLVKEHVSAAHAGKSLLYLNIIIPGAVEEEDIGCGILLDNMCLATGDDCGVALEVGETPAQ